MKRFAKRFAPLLSLAILLECDLAIGRASTPAESADTAAEAPLAKLIRIGGKSIAVNKYDSGVRVILMREMVSDENLAVVAQVESLTAVVLQAPNSREAFSARGIEHLSTAKELKSFSTCGCPMAPDLFRALKHIKNLERVAIRYSLIDVESAQMLSEIKTLKEVELSCHTGIDDRHIVAICALPSIEKLYVYRTNASNASLESVRKLPALKFFDARFTFVTERPAQTIKSYLNPYKSE